MTRPYRVLFCGGREWSAAGPIIDKLSTIRDKHPDVELVHGAGRGADMIAGAAAESLGIPCHAFPADWNGEGKAGGPLRNQRMLEFGIDAVYAFKENFDRRLLSGGTEHMVRIASQAGVPCQVIMYPVPEIAGPVIHSATGRTTEGMSTKCGLERQHYSTCSGFQSAVTCEECK